MRTWRLTEALELERGKRKTWGPSLGLGAGVGCVADADFAVSCAPVIGVFFTYGWRP